MSSNRERPICPLQHGRPDLLPRKGHIGSENGGRAVGIRYRALGPNTAPDFGRINLLVWIERAGLLKQYAGRFRIDGIGNTAV